MRRLLLATTSILALSIAVDAHAADLPAPYAPWSWTGFYVGAHVGGAWGSTNFSDPFGGSIFGDHVHTPGFLGGGQIGYNWQAPGTSWVVGLEADASALDSDGTSTCFASSAITVNTTCRVRPDATATFAARFGFAVGPAGRTLIYGKGGLAWAHDTIDMALNAGGNPTFSTSSSQTVNLWGEAAGVGIEHALTPAWSVKLEYDYLNFGNTNVANLGSVSFVPTTPHFIVGTSPPGTSNVSQTIQQLKLGLNYKFGADPRAQGWNDPAYATKAVPLVSAWEFEAGGRYVGSWGRFQKDIGMFKSAGFSSISDVSRLTYSDMQTNAGEFFGRVDTPWNLFVKGYVGGGGIRSGHMNDEDFVLPFGTLLAAYSNTLTPTVNGDTFYGVIDAGFDVLRGPGYKAGVFGGYFAMNENMKGFGCSAIAFINCTPPIPASGSAIITESDRWRAARVGVSAETMLTDRIKVSGDIAYLPWVSFNGTDHHFFGNTGILAEEFPASGNGRGVQLDALISYYLTPQWSIGLGGRYWGLWTSSGQFNANILGGVPVPPTPPQFFKAQVEQAGAFVQTSYRFGSP